MKGALALAALLLTAGCDRMVRRDPPRVYAPWEEGLTLLYANPSRLGETRFQVRVKRVEETPQGRRVVESFGSLAATSDFTFIQQDGQVSMQMEGQAPLTILPQGFPDRVSRWVARDSVYSVLGRARVNLPGLVLPDPEALGVWIEAEPLSAGGLRRRTLLVPDIGEVETLDWSHGQWIVTNRLVSRGFTDPPIVRSAP